MGQHAIRYIVGRPQFAWECSGTLLTHRGTRCSNLARAISDRTGMIAVAGFPKAFPPAAYNFAGGGLIETRFRDIKWFEADYRVRWRWDNEALFKDEDGTFADQPFCVGCSVLNNGLVRDTRAFPECYHDWRYHGPVCKPPLEFVSAAFDIPFDRLEFVPLYARYHMRRDTADFYVNEDDADYMRDLWRPRDSYNLVHMDAAMGRRLTQTEPSLTPTPKAQPYGAQSGAHGRRSASAAHVKCKPLSASRRTALAVSSSLSADVAVCLLGARRDADGHHHRGARLRVHGLMDLVDSGMGGRPRSRVLLPLPGPLRRPYGGPSPLQNCRRSVRRRDGAQLP